MGGELTRGQQRNIELAAQPADTTHQIDSRADDGEIEALRRANIAVGRVADVKRDAEVDLG